jgi:hypothetical protein
MRAVDSRLSSALTGIAELRPPAVPQDISGVQVVHHQLSAIFQHMYLEKKQSIGENAHAGGAMLGMGMGGMQRGGMPLQQQGGFAGSMNEAQAAEIVYCWIKEQPENSQGYREESIIAGTISSNVWDLCMCLADLGNVLVA